jgi:hypothetical protein
MIAIGIFYGITSGAFSTGSVFYFGRSQAMRPKTKSSNVSLPTPAGVPIIGGDAASILEQGKKIVICSMAGNQFAWFVDGELASRLTKADSMILIQQFAEALHRTCAMRGNVLL